MIAEQLRKSVLQAAIQGELTEQLPGDGDARDLLAEIKVEKARLIKEGRIKNEKPLPEITEEEIPFDIPGNWCWVRLGEISRVLNGDRGKNYPGKEHWTETGVPFINAGCLQGKYLSEKHFNFIPVTRYKMLRNGFIKKGDILYCLRGSLGKVSINRDYEEGAIASSLSIIRLINPCIKDYFYYVFASPLGIELIKRVDNGTAQPNLSAKSVKSYLIPLPPFAEQQRIVERLEDILPEIEKLQKDETKLEALQKSFPKKMKDSILQSAIQGRLTEQLKSDGDARDLVRSIEKEKERLIKERKIKKEKPLPEITEDEIPFDIPNNWCWVRLNDLLMLGDGQKMNGQKYINMEVKYLRGQISGNVLNAGKFIEKGSKVILVDGENSGEVFTIPEDGYMGSTFKRLMIVVEEFWPYLEFFLKKQQTLFRNNKTGSAIPHLNKTLFKEMLVPLPPLSEQQRIVERLNQLLPLCDALD